MPDPVQRRMNGDYPRFYRSDAGSTVEVPRWGVYEIEWDWFEECLEPGLHVSFDDSAPDAPGIYWNDDEEGGFVPVRRVRDLANTPPAAANGGREDG